MRPRTIAIIGAGFSGSLTAIHLARSPTTETLEIFLIDRRGTFGPGLAYSPPSDSFTLNVKAQAMGAFPDDPQGFLRWIQEREPQTSPDDFVSRARYGDYLSHLVEQAASTTQRNRIIRIHDEVTSLTHDSKSNTFTVKLTNGEPLSADRCVLAIGNLMKGALEQGSSGDIFRNPYDSKSYSDAASLNSLAIIGAGLTSVDVILEAESRGFCGHYTLISRHGRLPLSHEPNAPHMQQPLPAGWESSGSVLKLLKMVRQRSQHLASSQPVIEAMRPQLQEMWRNLSLAERRRFLRHVRPVWEVHRHRIPAEHALSIQRLRDSRRLDLIAGRVVSMSEERGTVTIQVLPRGDRSAPRAVHSDAIFLCAGTEGELSRVADPLIQDLLRQELITTGPLKLGAEETKSNSAGASTKVLWILGPLQRETRWEITAVRELREEALSVAQQVMSSLKKD